MTRVEMRKLRKKQSRKRFAILTAIILVSYALGILTYEGFCTSVHEVAPKVVEQAETITFCSAIVETPPKEVVEPEEPEEVVEEPEAEAEAEVEEFVSHYTYTEEEFDLLARLIYSEGGTESYETKLKIGSVVMNRVTEDTYFPNTIEDVIYQKNQFSVTTTKINGIIMIDRPADEESKRAAREVLDYGSVLPLDVQVFYAKGLCEGNWVTTREVYGTYDKTVFAYIYEKGNVQ